MSNFKNKPGGMKRGDPLPGASFYNKLIQQIPGQIGAGGTAQSSSYGDRVIISPEDRPRKKDDQKAVFAIVQEFDDYLLCVRLNYGFYGDGPGDCAVVQMPPVIDENFAYEIPTLAYEYVAKPLMLQRTPFDGQTIAGVTYAYDGVNSTAVHPPAMDHDPGHRTAVEDSVSTEEYVTPTYKVGETITAIRRVSGYYDPNQVNQVFPFQGAPEIRWQDVNEAGRTWLPDLSSAGVDEKVKASGADTTAGYLYEKLLGDGIIVSVSTPGANEDVLLTWPGMAARGVDLSPSFTGVKGFEFEELDGLEISQAGTWVKIKVKSASLTQRGIISLDDQVMGLGDKWFTGKIGFTDDYPFQTVDSGPYFVGGTNLITGAVTLFDQFDYQGAFHAGSLHFGGDWRNDDIIYNYSHLDYANVSAANFGYPYYVFGSSFIYHGEEVDDFVWGKQTGITLVSNATKYTYSPVTGLTGGAIAVLWSAVQNEYFDTNRDVISRDSPAWAISDYQGHLKVGGYHIRDVVTDVQLVDGDLVVTKESEEFAGGLWINKNAEPPTPPYPYPYIPAGINRFNLGVVSTAGFAEPDLTMPNLTVPGGSLLIVRVVFCLTSAKSPSVTFDGVEMDAGTGSAFPMGSPVEGLIKTFSMHVTTTTFGDIVVTPSGGDAAMIMSASYQTGLTDFAMDQSDNASGSTGAPTLTLPTTTIADQYIDACFALIKDGSLPFAGDWDNGFSDGLQSSSFTVDGTSVRVSLEEGFMIVDATGDYEPALTGSTQDYYAGTSCTFS